MPVSARNFLRKPSPPSRFVQRIIRGCNVPHISAPLLPPLKSTTFTKSFQMSFLSFQTISTPLRKNYLPTESLHKGCRIYVMFISPHERAQKIPLNVPVKLVIPAKPRQNPRRYRGENAYLSPGPRNCSTHTRKHAFSGLCHSSCLERDWEAGEVSGKHAG